MGTRTGGHVNEELPMNEALVKREAQPVARMDAVAILQASVQGGITSENVAVVERMAALVERQQDRQAERDYSQALFDLQQECGRVIAMKMVDDKYRYAPYLDIWKQVEGPIRKAKFTLQWGQTNENGMVTKILTLQHLNGHKRDFKWTIRVGTNAPGTPAGAQAPVLDEQADSRAKRRLLLDVLNITVDSTGDLADVGTGETISAEKSEELFKRWMNVSQNQKAFLDVAGVDAWDKIQAIHLPVLERMIAARERATKGKAQP
jgi:hypothetical protein